MLDYQPSQSTPSAPSERTVVEGKNRSQGKSRSQENLRQQPLGERSNTCFRVFRGSVCSLSNLSPP